MPVRAGDVAAVFDPPSGEAPDWLWRLFEDNVIERYTRWGTSKCQLWQGPFGEWGRNRSGQYSVVMVNGRALPVHRVRYELNARRPINAGNHIHHDCGRPDCINLEHLIEMTPEEHAEHHGRIDRRNRTSRRRGRRRNYYYDEEDY